MRKQIPVPLEQSDEFRLIADHGKFLIAQDVENLKYKIWVKAPRKRYYTGVKYRGVVWGLATGDSMFVMLTQAEQEVCRRLREALRGAPVFTGIA